MIFKTTDDGGLTNIFRELKSVQVTFEELDKSTLRSVINAFNSTSLSVDDLSTRFGGLDNSVVAYLNNTERGQASMDGLSKSIDNSATSMISATAKAKILAVALNALTGLAISLAIKGITWVVDELIVTLDEQKEKLDETVTAYEESKSELEKINDELKTTGERIDELNSKENLTFTEQDELEKLIKTNDELERKIYLLEQANKEAEKEVATEAQNTYDKYTNNRTSGAVEQIKFYSDSSLLEGVDWDNFKGDLSWLIAQYKHQEEILADAQANGWATIETQAESNLALLEGYMSEASLDYQDLYDKISGISNYAMTDDLKVAKQDLDDILDIVSEILGYGGQRSETNFDDIWNSEDFSQYKTELESLAKEGKLDASVLESNENYKKLLDDTGATAKDTAQHINALVDEMSKTGTQNLDGIVNGIEDSRMSMISDINDLSEGFEELDKIYESILDEDPFDFKLLDEDDFKESFSGLETYADFIEQITGNSDDIASCQDAFNNMVTEWINGSKILENVTEENAKLTASFLEQMGITNAEELVTEALANSKRKLAVEEELLAAQKRETISATTDLTNITASEIAALINEGIATQDTTTYLADMWFAKLDLNNLRIDTKSDVNNIIAIANACSASTEYVGALINALSYFNTVSTSGGILAQAWGKLQIQSILSQIQAQQLDPTRYYGKTTANYGGGSSSKKTSGGSSGSGSSGSSSSAKETEESFNWVERVIKKVQRTIDNLSKTVSATYKSWTTRNNALAQQISAINSEISTQQKAYDYYMKKANSLGLSSAYVNKIKDGTISIETITNESLIDKIKEYQDLYDQACDAQDAIIDLKDEIASLARQRFDNVISEYDSQLAVIEHRANMLEAYLDQTEARGYLASTKYYEALKQAEKENIALLEAEYASLTSQLENSMKTGNIEEGSEEWASMKEEIYGVEEALVEANTALIEYNNSMRELEWEVFDYLQDRISVVTDETQFLIDLISSKDLHDDKGNLTDEGMATMGLHGQNYNVYMSQADQYAKEIEEINKELEVDPNNTELIERKEELLDLQRESILAAEDEKQAIIDLVQEGIEKELEALQDLIDSYTEALDSAKDLYDYQKRVKELTSEISSLEKQKSAYLGDDSEENQARIQQIKVKLEEARENLEETEYEHYISEQKKLLDTLFNEYEAMLNARLDNVDALLSDMIDTINANASTIDETLRAESEKVGYTMTDSLQDIWSNEGCATSIISKYGDGFLTQLTSVNNVLNAIAKKIGAMTEESDKQAETNIKNETAKQETKPSSSSTTTKPSTNTTTTTTKTIKVGGKINAGSAKIYDYVGDTSGETQYYKKDPVYTVLEEKSGYLKVRHHSLSSGITGWFKKSDVKAYKTGGLVDETGLAWLDGTKTKPELVLNSKDTENIVGAADTLRNMVTKGILSQLNDFTETYGFNGGLPKIPSSTSIGDVTNQINIAIDRVLDYNDFCNQLREDPQFEKMVQAMTTDQIAGKSKLAKNKFRW